MTRKEQIRNAYKLTGGHASFYDGMMTYSTFSGKAICRVVWNMDQEKNYRYLEHALSGIPEDFTGKLLEVPVGTGVLTMPVYRELPNADITCLDYSYDMMRAAEKRAESLNIGNIRFLQGDVGALPFEDESFDITLLLGPLYHLHTAADRIQALSEAKRITRKGGVIFAAYIMNEYSVLTYCFKEQHIAEVLSAGALTDDWHTQPDKDGLYSYLRLEDINALKDACRVERRRIFAADGAADYMRREINALSESDFAHFIRYHLATCERPELLGASSHTVDVLVRGEC